ncbi:SAM-dependent methyltransferase [Caldibacillus thermoamylovorans]|uniref:class I SAM-dependent methyltransferase n=1 Tax=Caldibacillus thermoamylovorans TaxID=35841 RepID=UPI000D557CE8|nr:class I SAM-dependent methyltransferase [Caldibacillus thermoamylovorans]AWI11496.1 SAM-dependent methyltransferase [Caldibacillus thermoamylovorans]
MSKEHWDKSFSDKDFVYGEKENQFIHDMSEIIPAHSKVGCFAEGEGRNAVYLAKLGHDVIAYDQSLIGLEKTKTLATKNKVVVETVAMDLTKEKVQDNQFDTSIMVFGHVPKKDQKFLIKNLVDSVKPGGYVIFEVYSEDQIKYQTGGPQSLDMLYNPIEVLEWIKNYHCIHFYYGEVTRNEGKRHVGLGHVIQVVIKK